MAGGECEGGLTTLQEVCVGAALKTAALLLVGLTLKLRIRRETKFHQLPGIHKGVTRENVRPPSRFVFGSSQVFSDPRALTGVAFPNHYPRPLHARRNHCWESRIRTTSESIWPRMMANFLPSGDQAKLSPMCSDLKLVSWRPADPSSGCSQRLSTSWSRIG